MSVRRVGAALVVALLVACGSAQPQQHYIRSESGFRVTTVDIDKPCGGMSNQWEQTHYPTAPTTTTLSGLKLSGLAPPLGAATELDRIATDVAACLELIIETAPAARCWPAKRWRFDASCTTVHLVAGERACTADAWLLPDDAGKSCDTWGKPAADCPCRWAIATQDAGRTIVLPQQDPTTRFAEGVVRASTGCLYPWLDTHVAVCSQLH